AGRAHGAVTRGESYCDAANAVRHIPAGEPRRSAGGRIGARLRSQVEDLLEGTARNFALAPVGPARAVGRRSRARVRARARDRRADPNLCCQSQDGTKEPVIRRVWTSTFEVRRSKFDVRARPLFLR